MTSKETKILAGIIVYDGDISIYTTDEAKNLQELRKGLKCENSSIVILGANQWVKCVELPEGKIVSSYYILSSKVGTIAFVATSNERVLDPERFNQLVIQILSTFKFTK